MTFNAPRRHIVLEGSYNTRDIGGYPIEEGGTTRWKTFIRSDGMHRLTDDDQVRLMDYGVRTVIDLRTTVETETTPNVFADSAHPSYHHCNLIGDAQYEREAIAVPAVRIARTYTRWLDERQAQVADALKKLASPGSQTAIYHCASGKDRAGLITALLLSLAGVSRDVVVADYALTAEFLYMRLVSGGAPSWEEEVGSPAEFEALYCPRDGMARTFAHLDRVYGSVEEYAQSIGLTPGQIGNIRSALAG